MPKDLKKNVEYILKDLHARESMRLGCYRQWAVTGEHIQKLRERKASHQAFLHQLLRKRDLTPAWYAKLYYYFGHISGLVTAFLPAFFVHRIEKMLEFWILQRYQKYFKRLELDHNIRSMIEAVQMNKLSHNEPALDILILLKNIINDQEAFQSV